MNQMLEIDKNIYLDQMYGLINSIDIINASQLTSK